MARVISQRAISIKLALITVTWNCGFDILSTTESLKEIASFIQVLDSILKHVAFDSAFLDQGFMSDTGKKC